ncbi:methyltransferase domain-containing protein [bacterium]|nr:methyltransferase domain-containing protein [bacterium]
MSHNHRDYFNDLAPVWNDRMQDDPSLGAHMDRFGISPGQYVLDVGAGTGRLVPYLLARTGGGGRVIVQDIADRMLAEGTRRHGTEAVWLCSDVHALPLPGNLFDSVICYSAFPHFQNKQQALAEMARVLKPGGRILILHSDSSDTLNAFHAQLAGPVHADRLPAAPGMAALLKKAGFRPLILEERTGLYWVEARKLP